MKIVNIGHVCIDNNISEGAEYISIGGPSSFMNKIYKHFHDVDYTIVSHYGKNFGEYAKNLPIYPKKFHSDKTLE